jgi:hypothetical protein
VGRVVHRVDIVGHVIVQGEPWPHFSNDQIAYGVFQVGQATPEFTDLSLAERGVIV